MQAARSSDHEPAVRTIGVGELKAQADEIIREVSETGRPIDIVQNGQVTARLSPVPTADPASADVSFIDARERAIRDWLSRMDEVSREIGAAWPKGVSAQEAIDDVRGPW